MNNIHGIISKRTRALLVKVGKGLLRGGKRFVLKVGKELEDRLAKMTVTIIVQCVYALVILFILKWLGEDLVKLLEIIELIVKSILGKSIL